MSDWVIATTRLGLRRLTSADRAVVAELDWLDTDRVMTRALADYARLGHSFWAVESLSTGEFVGLCGLLAQDVEGKTELEVGYHLLPRFQRRGFAAEAARGVMDYAFDTVGVMRIISIILPDNRASIGVALKNGLAFERAARFRNLDVGIYVAARSSGPV